MAANQPSTRPFFRLGSLSRPAVQPQPSAPLVRPPLARPTITVPFTPPPPQPQPTRPQEPTPPPPPAAASVPTSPIPRTIAPSSFPAPKSVPSSTMAPLVTSTSSVPSSPNQSNIISASSSSLPAAPPLSVQTLPIPNAAAMAAATRVPTATASPKIIKPSAPPPSPLSLLPPSQLKSVTETEAKISLQVFEQKKGTKDVVVAKEKFSDSDGVGVRVNITRAGKNKGAFMEKKQQQFGTASTVAMRAFINSNVQGVNNSILHNCSCTHHDPGVHVSLPTNPAAGPAIHLRDQANGHHT